jgi:hypothetical protein
MSVNLQDLFLFHFFSSYIYFLRESSLAEPPQAAGEVSRLISGFSPLYRAIIISFSELQQVLWLVHARKNSLNSTVSAQSGKTRLAAAISAQSGKALEGRSVIARKHQTPFHIF